MHRYWPAKVWAVAHSSDSLKNKFRYIATFMCNNLGLRHPDEQTKKLVVVCVLIASNLDPGPDEAYEHVREFSAIMDQKRSSTTSAQTMTTFPADPADFMKLFPSAYGEEDPPVKCRIDDPLIKERCRKDITPTRSSNMLVKRSNYGQSHQLVPVAHNQGSQRDTSTATLMSMLQHFMMNAAVGSRPNIGPQTAPPHAGCEQRHRKAICDQPQLADDDKSIGSGDDDDDDDGAHSLVDGWVPPKHLPSPIVHSESTHASSVHDKLLESSASIQTTRI
jgi:hypothetical protein